MAERRGQVRRRGLVSFELYDICSYFGQWDPVPGSTLDFALWVPEYGGIPDFWPTGSHWMFRKGDQSVFVVLSDVHALWGLILTLQLAVTLNKR